MLAVTFVGQKELGVALETGGEGGVGAEIGSGILAAVPSRHVEGAGSSPTIKRFHPEVVVVLLREHTVAVARFVDGHGKNG